MISRPANSEGQAPRLALISPDRAFRGLLASCLEQLAVPVEWVLRAENELRELRPESVDQIAERNPDVLFIDVGDNPLSGARFISAVAARAPEVTVVAAGAALNVDDLLQVIRAGASGYLRRPLNRDEVTEACANVLRRVRPRAETGAPEHVARVVALFSPKGGTGVSTLAANLALHIRRATQKKTLLLDLSPELGTCSVLLGMEPRYSYLDVIENLHRMDEGLLHSFLEDHESGTRVLASPASVFAARELAPESVAYLLRLVRRHFEYVVVDVGRSTVDQAALKALELADDPFIVSTTELPTLRNVRRVLPHLPVGDEPDESRVRLLVNRYDEGSSVSKKDIERAVGLPLFKTLTEDRERVSSSVDLGQPIVLNGSSPYAKTVVKLGNLLAKDDLLAKNGKRSLGGLLRAMVPFKRANGQRASRTAGTGSGSRAQRNAAE